MSIIPNSDNQGANTETRGLMTSTSNVTLQYAKKTCYETTKKYLFKRTKMFSIFMGYPAIIAFFLDMIVSVIYHVTYGSYKVCATIKSDWLNVYLYGCITCYTILPIGKTVMQYTAIRCFM